MIATLPRFFATLERWKISSRRTEGQMHYLLSERESWNRYFFPAFQHLKILLKSAMHSRGLAHFLCYHFCNFNRRRKRWEMPRDTSSGDLHLTGGWHECFSHNPRFNRAKSQSNHHRFDSTMNYVSGWNRFLSILQWFQLKSVRRKMVETRGIFRYLRVNSNQKD